MNSSNFEELFDTTKDLNWNYDFLSSCTYITWSMVRNNLNKPWNLKKLSRNTIITIDIVLDNPFLRWNWVELTLNENMTFDVIKNYARQPWDIEALTTKLTSTELQEFYDIRDSFIDNNSIDSYDSYDSNDETILYKI
jgi:hypothetical protein